MLARGGDLGCSPSASASEATSEKSPSRPSFLRSSSSAGRVVEPAVQSSSFLHAAVHVGDPNAVPEVHLFLSVRRNMHGTFPGRFRSERLRKPV